jgi:hypothetical protein
LAAISGIVSEMAANNLPINIERRGDIEKTGKWTRSKIAKVRRREEE